MNIILGERDYEKTGSGKYPKYNLDQMNLFVNKNSEQYTGIQLVINIKCFDLFGKYEDETNDDEKKTLYNAMKDEYGIHNVCFDDLIDWDGFDYDEEEKLFTEKKK